MVDSPSPAAAYTYAARQRDDAERASSCAVLGPADRDRAAGQVGQHRRAGQRRLRRRRHRHPHVLADLDVQHEPGHVVGREQQVGPDRHLDARHPDRARRVVARRDLAALVELPVGRQVRLRREPEQPPPVHDGGDVHDPVPVADRQPDDQHRQQLGRSLDHGRRARVRPRPAAGPAGGCPRSSTRTASARGRSRARRLRRRTRARPAAPTRRSRADRRSPCAACRRPPAGSRAVRRPETVHGAVCPNRHPAGRGTPACWWSERPTASGHRAVSGYGAVCRGRAARRLHRARAPVTGSPTRGGGATPAPQLQRFYDQKLVLGPVQAVRHHRRRRRGVRGRHAPVRPPAGAAGLRQARRPDGERRRPAPEGDRAGGSGRCCSTPAAPARPA